MLRTNLLTAATIAALCPLAGLAATVNANLSYSDTAGLFGSSLGFDESTSFGVGIGRVDFGARASSGDVNAQSSFSLSATFERDLSLQDAATASVGLSFSNLQSSFDTFMGATAGAGVDFNNIPVPLAPDINPPRISLGEVGYSIQTDASLNGFGSVSDRTNEPITGFGIPTYPGVSLQAELTLDGSQTSTLSIDDLFGVVQATHEGGSVFTDAFSLRNDATSILDLSLSGDWALELVGVGIANSFDSSLGLAASARIGYAVGFNCGDFSTNSDNGFGCVIDNGSVASSPQLTLIDPTPFGLDFGLKNVDLGLVSVAPAPVPLPAGMALMLGGLGAFGLARRKSAA